MEMISHDRNRIHDIQFLRRAVGYSATSLDEDWLKKYFIDSEH